MSGRSERNSPLQPASQIFIFREPIVALALSLEILQSEPRNGSEPAWLKNSSLEDSRRGVVTCSDTLLRKGCTLEFGIAFGLYEHETISCHVPWINLLGPFGCPNVGRLRLHQGVLGD